MEQTIVLYDGACKMCVGFSGWLAKLDDSKQFKLLPFQDNAVRQLFPNISEMEYQQAIHVITPTKKILRGADAVLQIWIELNRISSPIAYVFRVVPFIWIARLIYRLVARFRKDIY